MSTYQITESPLGTYTLTLGNQLVAQATDKAALERVKTGLEHRHPDRKNNA